MTISEKEVMAVKSAAGNAAKNEVEEEYTAKHDSSDKRVVHIFRAEVKEHDFDQEKLKRLETENNTLRERLHDAEATLRGGAEKEIRELKRIIEEKDIRISKLETALIEAAIR